eukprot:5032319-Pyramimonas_sp.AAC.1
MPSTALPRKSNDEVDCDLMFYKREHILFHAIYRCARYGAGMLIPCKTMVSFLDAFHQCWLQSGLAEVLYSDGGGALDEDTAEAVLKAKGTELRIGARGQHATTIEARSGMLRHLLNFMEAELNRLDIPLVFTRLPRETLFAASAFTCYMRCLHAARCSDGSRRCYPTCLFWAANSRRKHPTTLENGLSAA